MSTQTNTPEIPIRTDAFKEIVMTFSVHQKPRANEMTADNLRTAIEQAGKNFDGWDWTMMFSDVEYTSRPDDHDRSAGADEARAYDDDVEVAVAECRDFGQKAIEAINTGDLPQAIALLEDAERAERQFGDAPEWGSVLEMARSIAPESPSRIPDYEDTEASMQQWFEAMRASDLMFHPDDDPGDIIDTHNRNGGPLFTDTEAAQIRGILVRMFEQHGDHVYEVACPVVMNAFHAGLKA